MLFVKYDIPVGEYVEIMFDIEINSRSFQYAENSLVKDFTLINSLNRTIPDEVRFFSFRANFIDNSLAVEKIRLVR